MCTTSRIWSCFTRLRLWAIQRVYVHYLPLRIHAFLHAPGNEGVRFVLSSIVWRKQALFRPTSHHLPAWRFPLMERYWPLLAPRAPLSAFTILLMVPNCRRYVHSPYCNMSGKGGTRRNPVLFVLRQLGKCFASLNLNVELSFLTSYAAFSYPLAIHGYNVGLLSTSCWNSISLNFVHPHWSTWHLLKEGTRLCFIALGLRGLMQHTLLLVRDVSDHQAK